jgi:hypothetical protein
MCKGRPWPLLMYYKTNISGNTEYNLERVKLGQSVSLLIFKPGSSGIYQNRYPFVPPVHWYVFHMCNICFSVYRLHTVNKHFSNRLSALFARDVTYMSSVLRVWSWVNVKNGRAVTQEWRKYQSAESTVEVVRKEETSISSANFPSCICATRSTWVKRMGSEMLFRLNTFRTAFLMSLLYTCCQVTVKSELYQRWGRPQWPGGLRRRFAAERLLGSWVRIPQGAWMFVSSECLCCQVEVSATGRSLVQRSPTDCGVCLSVIKCK